MHSIDFSGQKFILLKLSTERECAASFWPCLQVARPCLLESHQRRAVSTNGPMSMPVGLSMRMPVHRFMRLNVFT